jgi:predicted phage baseplate assembly protein
MSEPQLSCHNEERRADLRSDRRLNGLDYLELLPINPADPNSDLALTLFFIGKAPANLKPGNIRIEGGRRIRDLRATAVSSYRQEDRERDDCVVVYLDRRGDFSPYSLRLVEINANGYPSTDRLAGIDPRYDRLEFSFLATCPSDLDCAAEPPCPPPAYSQPAINYLAKDYASFRQLILDRLALIMPDWQERHVPDLGLTLVEMLAYTGDYLSYYQDAVATEAYLETARQRISVRRHARLIDYALHEGCNARAWLTVAVGQDSGPLQANELYFITDHPDLPRKDGGLSQEDLQGIPPDSYAVFEPLYERNPDQFTPTDLPEPASLALVLKARNNPAVRLLSERLSPETLRMLHDLSEQATAISAALEAALLADLNRLLQVRTLLPLYHALGLQLDLDITIGYWLLTGGYQQNNRQLLEQVLPGLVRKSSELHFYAAHNEFTFYTWGNSECCLPKGSTSAWLRDEWEVVGQPPNQRVQRKLRHLRPGDVLIVEELIGPRTGKSADADPAHRHALRLTRIEPITDPLYRTTYRLQEINPDSGALQTVEVELEQPLLEIHWQAADALPFPLCLSVVGPAPACILIENVSIARGNVILVDHGRSTNESLGSVLEKETEVTCEHAGYPGDTTLYAEQFRPTLQFAPLTYSQPLNLSAPASATLQQEPRRALPWVALTSTGQGRGAGGAAEASGPPAASVAWQPRADLLASGWNDAHFVVEHDDRGRAHLRFGDGELGLQPAAGAAFRAAYRVGNGPAGNVGADRIKHLVWRTGRASGTEFTPCNPMPAQGGLAPEPVAEARLVAPTHFRSHIQRAITADDYTTLVMRMFGGQVQRAVTHLCWTGSHYEARIAIDPLGTNEASPALLSEIAQALEPYRRMGHSLAVEPAHYVGLEVTLLVCVKPHYLRGQIKAALLERFSNRRLSGGQLGYFHPDKLSFGDAIYLSQIVAAAQAVEGVDNIVVQKLERRFDGPNGEIEHGLLPIGSREIARLDNDPSFPEYGVFQLKLEGGR